MGYTMALSPTLQLPAGESCGIRWSHSEITQLYSVKYASLQNEKLCMSVEVVPVTLTLGCSEHVSESKDPIGKCSNLIPPHMGPQLGNLRRSIWSFTT